jgi:hypothetical protein
MARPEQPRSRDLADGFARVDLEQGRRPFPEVGLGMMVASLLKTEAAFRG